MRTLIIIIALLLFKATDSGAAKYGLLIGIEAYSNGVPPLHGPKDDALNIKKLLLEHGGYQENNLTLLVDGEATRDQILHQLSHLADKSRRGDEVVVYYSGHGSQTVDMNNDEDDSLDETLVPVDTFKKAGIFHNMITDDEVQERLRAMPAEKISFIIDSCHSGTITRGLGEISSEVIGVAKTITPGVQPEVSVQDLYERRRNETVFLGKRSQSEIAVWTAASSSQLAFTDIETKKGSLFTNRLIAGLGEKKADFNKDSMVSNSELLEFLRNESDSFCRRNKKICRLGLTPTLETSSDKLPQRVAFLNTREVGIQSPNSTPLAAYIDSVSTHRNKEKIKVQLYPGENIKIGKALTLQITTPMNGYLLILDVDSKGRITQLFPNKFSKIPWNQRFAKNAVFHFPEKSYGFDFIASEPIGRGRIITVVVEDELTFENLLKQNMSLEEVKNEKHYLAELAYSLRATYRGDKYNRRVRWSVQLTEYNIIK